jgi:CRISPR-associated protein Csb2
MLLIELTFPAGRYHATAWGRHVNEGVPEWPPSPYRLVRALYDAWKRKRPEWEEVRVSSLLAAISSSAPLYRLPEATVSHTRSFLSKNEEDPQSKTLVFDGFVVLSPRSTVLIGWPDTALALRASEDLDELLSLLNYLGRSESWITARLVSGVSAVEWNCFPETHASDASEVETVPVATPTPQDEYRPIEIGRGRAARQLSWMEALTTGTDVIQKSGWSHPPAMRYTDYLRPTGCLEPTVAAGGTRSTAEMHSVLYAFDSKVLPQVTETIVIGEHVRRGLMSKHKELVGAQNVSFRFSGKSLQGEPIREPIRGHQHAFYLPLDRDGDGRLDHVLVYCQTPFQGLEVVALDRLRSLWQSGGRPALRCIPVQWNAGPSEAKVFVSTTPFVPPRHAKFKRDDFETWIRTEVARECANHGLPTPVKVSGVRELALSGGRSVRWFEFRRNRKDDPVRSGYGLRIEFNQEIKLPLALGYGCHFGLGQFRPE